MRMIDELKQELEKATTAIFEHMSTIEAPAYWLAYSLNTEEMESYNRVLEWLDGDRNELVPYDKLNRRGNDDSKM